MKILGSIIIFLACTITGFIYGEGLRKRVKALIEVERALYNLENQIVYTYTPLPEAFKIIASKCNGAEGKLFSTISELLEANSVENVYQGFCQAFEKNKSELNLSSEDISIILDLAKNLGESDMEGQRNMFMLTYKNIRKQLETADSNLCKNLKMYRGLGISAGAAIVILLL